MSYMFADSLRAGLGRMFRPDPAVWHIPLPCVQWKTPDNGQRNCPKHVEFYSKNKFERLVHLVGFIIRILWTRYQPDAETSNWQHTALTSDRHPCP